MHFNSLLFKITGCMPKGNPAITHNSTKLATFNKVKVSKILWGFRKMKFISVAKHDGPTIFESYAAREIAQPKVPLSIFF